jgi:hypothetical protein
MVSIFTPVGVCFIMRELCAVPEAPRRALKKLGVAVFDDPSAVR